LKPDVGSPLTEVSERPTASAHLSSGSLRRNRVHADALTL